MTPAQREAILAEVKGGNKIAAIKLCREATGMGLAEAKDWVEKLEASRAASDDPEAELVAKAEAGDANSQFDLGIAYVNGIMGRTNFETAVKWIRCAAEQGLPEAQFALGAHYHRGQGVSEDKEQAVAWYRRAALQGNAAAQFNLGYCYEIGEGVQKDRDEAIAWYRRATALGDLEAKAALRDLTKGEADPESEAVSGAREPHALEPRPAPALVTVADLLFAGRKIDAIKLYREQVKPGAGLAESKEAVEKLEAGLRAQHPEKFSAKAKSGCTTVLAVLAVLLVVLVWIRF